MKKGLRKIIVLALLLFETLLSCNVYGLGGHKIEKISGEEIVKKEMIFESGGKYLMKIKCSPEMSLYDKKLNKDVYRKTVRVNGEFFNQKDRFHNIFKKRLESFLSVTFTYDKNEFVRIDQPKKDISLSKCRFDNTKWKIRQNYEIFNTGSDCIVSRFTMLYKDPGAGRHLEYIDNLHLDLICSIDGDISFNSLAS